MPKIAKTTADKEDVRKLGLTDERGREICVLYGWYLDDGAFIVWVQAGRDGVKYGARGPHAEVDNAEEASAWVEAKIVEMQKRYAKKRSN